MCRCVGVGQGLGVVVIVNVTFQMNVSPFAESSCSKNAYRVKSTCLIQYIVGEGVWVGWVGG